MVAMLETDLIQKLERVHTVLQTVFKHYEAAERLEAQAMEAEAAVVAQKKKYVIFAILAAMCMFPFGLIVTAVILYIYHTKRKTAAALSEECRKKAAIETAAAEQFVVDNIETLSVLPNDYWYPLATENIIKLLSSGRASNFNDALDRFDALRREWLMDERYAAVAGALAQQTENLRSIEKSSRITAVINVAQAAAGITRGVSRGVGSLLDVE